MTEDKKQKKNFVDPTLAYAVGIFTVRAILQSVVGWMGLEFFKVALNKAKGWFANGKSTDERISEEKSTEKT